jgi:hypothetical protein
VPGREVQTVRDKFASLSEREQQVLNLAGTGCWTRPISPRRA